MKENTNPLPLSWKNIKWVLTDVDDTLTWQGRLPPETLIALNKLQQANIKVVAVTGACAGWCDHIAQLWPVDAVLGENGAFIMEKVDGVLQLKPNTTLEDLSAKQQGLKQQILTILERYPDLGLTLDQSYRLCEVAIDIGQNRPRVEESVIQAILEEIHALGAHATASSIHINAWYGSHSKLATSFGFLRGKGLAEEGIKQLCCYVGDSLNDQQMFSALPMSVGVANLADYWDKLQMHPQVMMTHPGGYGFAEFADHLLEIKATNR